MTWNCWLLLFSCHVHVCIKGYVYSLKDLIILKKKMSDIQQNLRIIWFSKVLKNLRFFMSRVGLSRLNGSVIYYINVLFPILCPRHSLIFFLCVRLCVCARSLGCTYDASTCKLSRSCKTVIRIQITDSVWRT